MTTGDNVTSFPQRNLPQRNGGNGGNGDARLHAVELDIREIKVKLEQVATREWILWRVLVLLLSAIGLSATLATAITFGLLRLFGGGDQ